MLWCLQQNDFVFLVQLRAETRVNQSFNMKRKFTQWSTFPPISTNTNNHISQSLTALKIKKETTKFDVGNPGLGLGQAKVIYRG